MLVKGVTYVIVPPVTPIPAYPPATYCPPCPIGDPGGGTGPAHSGGGPGPPPPPGGSPGSGNCYVVPIMVPCDPFSQGAVGNTCVGGTITICT